MRTFKDFIVEVEYRQGKLLTKKGTAQNFTNPKRVPFTSTDPVSSSGSKPSSAPKPVAKSSPGQMNIPGLSSKSKQSGQGGRSIGSTVSRPGAKITTPKSTGGPIGTRNVPDIKQVSAKYGKDAPAPKPQFGPGSTNTGQSFPKPPKVTRDAGAALRQRILSKPPSTATAKPTPTSTGASLSRGLKNIKPGGSLASTALNIATAGALDKYVAKPVGKALGNALARGVIGMAGKTNRATQISPSLYGKKGPDLTPGIVKGVKNRSNSVQPTPTSTSAPTPTPAHDPWPD